MSNKANTIFKSISETGSVTGFSKKYLREGCKDGTIPHIRIGEGENARFMVNLPLFIEQLNRKSISHE